MNIETVRIPYGSEGVPGTWFLVPHLDAWQPHHRCPKCRRGSVMANHSVQPDGTVHASIACFPPCDYHVYGILDGWCYGLKQAGQGVSTQVKEAVDGQS